MKISAYLNSGKKESNSWGTKDLLYRIQLIYAEEISEQQIPDAFSIS